MARNKRERAWDSNGLQDWGTYFDAKKSKIEDQFDELAKAEFKEATSLFKGIAIFVNGYTNPCADVLRRLMMEHGGVYHTYQRTNSTTHLIASNLPYVKINHYRKSKNPLPLCKPEWITDSIKQKKLLDWRPYLLYNNTSVTQPALQLQKLAKVPDPQLSTLNPITDETRTLPTTSDTPSTSALPQEPAENRPEESAQIQKKSPKIPDNPTKPALCSKDEEFISEFYNNSRLHHIATMGATFKDYVNELRLKSTGSLPGFDRLKASTKPPTRVPMYPDSDSDEDLFTDKHPKRQNTKESVIMHIDMDCFFVSVGLRNRPDLKGQPVAVTHAKGNKPSSKSTTDSEEFSSMAEIASCSYEARKMGLKNGMFLGQALKLCPNLKTIKYDFEGYKAVSYALYNTVASYTLEIEAVSCDEMYADISKVLNESNLTPSEFAEVIRAEIKEKTSCPVSTGFGRNKLQARLATKKAKPDGQFHLKGKDVESYIGAIGIGDIPGVGWATKRQLNEMNVEFCKDLQGVTLGVLQEKFGKKNGEMLFNTCRGIDHSKLSTEHVRKSVSAEVNYGIRFESDADARGFLTKLGKEVCSRLQKVSAKGRCVTLKLMVRAKNAPLDPVKFMGHGLCDNYTKSKNFMTPVDHEALITRDVLLLWEQMQQPAHEIRGIGIQISRLEMSKSKPINNHLTKFIARGKPVENSEPRKVESGVNQKQTSIPERTKNVEKKKPNDLRGFFTLKQSTTDNKKTSIDEEQTSKIDESVLAELPEDIRQEILNSHNQGIEQKNATSEILNAQKLSSSENRNPQTNEFLASSQGIDEDILIQLPEDIRNEILASKPAIKKSQSTGIDNYFKHQKPGTSFAESKMPGVQDLDMQVLIELPDEIRNEILNEYRTHKIEAPNEEAPKAKNSDLDCSFSQVDPDFLAALDNETRADVKRYCLAKKNEKELKEKKVMNNKPQSTDGKVKKRGRKPKALALVSKVEKKTSKKEIGKKKKPDTEYVKRSHSFLHEMSILGDAFVDKNDKGEVNRLRNAPININLENNSEDTKHQKMLHTLVTYLFSLPVQQVKRQIQTWIRNSNNVNEIDSLSITTYLSMLPKEKRLEDLHTLMKTMHRCMTETGSCVWHCTYKRTLQHVQQCMQIEYNSNLMLPAIRCNLRTCKSDGV